VEFYGWRIKEWRHNATNSEEKRQEMIDWCKKHEGKYQIRQIFINNAWAVEYRPLLHF